MENIFNILITAVPGILTALGALISDYAGVMAIFLEGIINFGAFSFIAACSYTESIFLGILCSVLLCASLCFFSALFVNKTKANIFLVGAAINLLSSGLLSLISTKLFNTNGVIPCTIIQPGLWFIRNGTTLFGVILSLLSILFLCITPAGLFLKITGTDSSFLRINGINPSKLKTASWAIAGFLAAAAGCILAIRVQSFVPNISAGRGWIALAAVFLGKKKTAGNNENSIFGTIAAAVIFSSAEYIANNLQGSFSIPPSLFLALPYVTSLVLLAVFSIKTSRQNYQ